MAKKKHGAASTKAQPAPKASGGRRILWIVGAAVAVFVIAALALSGGGGKKNGGLAGVDPEEQKYIGRLLPAGYQEPKLADFVAYSSAVSMSKLTPADAGSAISIPADEVVTKRIVFFEYSKPGARPVPLLAYAKPSGKLFVGVSFCPPCEGRGQRIEADVTLTCESCGTRRNVETGVGISGACKLYPLDELPVKVAGGKILLEKSAIENWTPQPKDRKIGG